MNLDNLSCINPAKGAFRLDRSLEQASFVSTRLFQQLQNVATRSDLTQSRVCLHSSDESLLQVMIIFHSKHHVVPRHQHFDKDEVIVIIQGSILITLYDNEGQESGSTLLSVKEALDSNTICLIPKGCVHHVKMNEDSVFLEVSTGPFNPEQTHSF